MLDQNSLDEIKKKVNHKIRSQGLRPGLVTVITTLNEMGYLTNGAELPLVRKGETCPECKGEGAKKYRDYYTGDCPTCDGKGQV